MRIDDPATTVVDFEVSTVVVASNDGRRPTYSFSTEGSVERNGFTSYFVTVPQGAGALQVNLSGIATGSQTRFIAINPYGVPVESTASTGCYTNFSDAAVCKPQERDYQNPIPGSGRSRWRRGGPRRRWTTRSSSRRGCRASRSSRPWSSCRR